MLDFQRGPKPRNYLSRREQWRVLMLVMMLGLVLVLALEAKKPENFAWFWALGPANPEGEPPLLGATQEPGGGQTPFPAAEAPFAEFFPGVRPETLETIRDDSPFVASEGDAWFHLLDLLDKTDEATLARASTGEATYVQLFEQADEYRGRLVTVQGVMRRAHRLAAPKNDYGIEYYYQTWVTPADDLDDLIVVYCLDPPDGFPTGMEIEEDVRLVGFFFKRWLYQAQDALRTTPVILAKSFTWHQKPLAPEPPAGVPFVGVIKLAGGAALLALVVTLYIYCRTRSGAQPASEGPAQELKLYASEVGPGVKESLEDLARGEESSPP